MASDKNKYVKYASGAEFWADVLERHGKDKGLKIGGNYLKAQLKTSDVEERQFCSELFAAMCEARGFEPERVVYPYQFDYAKEHSETHLYAESVSSNGKCARAIDDALRECCYEPNHYNIEGAAFKVLNEFGFDRVNGVMAAHINAHGYDGRYSQTIKRWAEKFEGASEKWRVPVFAAHITILDGFANEIRKLYTEFDAQSFTLPENCGGDIYDDYDLYRSVIFSDGHGIALGCSGNNSQHCVTYDFNLVDGERDYTFVHAWDGEAAALSNFKAQTAKYMTEHSVQICAPEFGSQTMRMS